MSSNAIFYLVVATTVLQVLLGIVQLKVAALLFEPQFFDLYLSLLLLTGVFVIIEQSIQTACINIFSHRFGAGLNEKNKNILIAICICFYFSISATIVGYVYATSVFAPFIPLFMLLLTFTCKSASTVFSNIFAAQRQIIIEKILKLSYSVLLTLAFIISWSFEVEDEVAIIILFFAALLGLFSALLIWRRKFQIINNNQVSILKEILSTFHYLLPGSIYIMILPSVVSGIGTTGEKAMLAILRQVVLAGSSLVLSPATSYLIFFVNTLKRLDDPTYIVSRLNKFFSIVVTLIFIGATFTMINFDAIFKFFVGSEMIDNSYLLFSLIVFYYLELTQNVLANLAVNLREYRTGFQIVLVSCLSVSTYFLFDENLALATSLFSLYTLTIISMRILKLVEKHVRIFFVPIALYIFGVVILCAIFLLSLPNTVVQIITYACICMGLIFYKLLRNEFKFIEERCKALD